MRRNARNVEHARELIGGVEVDLDRAVQHFEHLLDGGLVVASFVALIIYEAIECTVPGY